MYLVYILSLRNLTFCLFYSILQVRCGSFNTMRLISFSYHLQIEEIYKAYTQKLARVAHLMPPDVHKLMEDECLVNKFLKNIFVLLLNKKNVVFGHILS